MTLYDDVELLAGEYAVGSLPSEERASLEARAAKEADVAALIQGWEFRLAPLHELVAPVAPPASLWPRIEQRLGEVVQVPRRRNPNFLETVALLSKRQGGAAAVELMRRLRRWRALAVVAIAVAAALAALLAAVAVR